MKHILQRTYFNNSLTANLIYHPLKKVLDETIIKPNTKGITRMKKRYFISGGKKITKE